MDCQLNRRCWTVGVGLDTFYQGRKKKRTHIKPRLYDASKHHHQHYHQHHQEQHTTTKIAQYPSEGGEVDRGREFENHRTTTAPVCCVSSFLTDHSSAGC